MKDKEMTKEKKPESSKKNFRIQRIRLLFICLAVLVLVFVFNYENLSPTNISEWFSSIGGNGGFPYSLNNNSVKKIDTTDKNILLLTDSSILYLNSSGKDTDIVRHKYESPQFEVKGDYILAYDRGSTGFKVMKSKSTLHELTAEDDISVGAVSENGTFAIVTSSSEGASKLTMYNSNGKSSASWTTSNEYIVKVDLNGDSSTAAVATVSTSDADIVSRIYILNFDDGKVISRFEYDDCYLVDLSYNKNGSIAVVTDNLTSFISKEFVKKDDVHFEGWALSRYSISSDGSVAVLINDNDTNSSRLIYINNKGEKCFDIIPEKTVKWVLCSGNNVSVLMKNKAVKYNSKGESIKEMEVSNDVIRIFEFKRKLYTQGVSSIDKCGTW